MSSEVIFGNPVRLTFDSRIVVVAVAGVGIAASIAKTPAEAAALQTGLALALSMVGIPRTSAAIFSFPDDIESELFTALSTRTRNLFLGHVSDTVRRNIADLTAQN